MPCSLWRSLFSFLPLPLVPPFVLVDGESEMRLGVALLGLTNGTYSRALRGATDACPALGETLSSTEPGGRRGFRSAGCHPRIPLPRVAQDRNRREPMVVPTNPVNKAGDAESQNRR